MPAAHRHRDICDGHQYTIAPRPNIEASPDVFINGRGAHRVGDAWETHCSTSNPVQASGSPTVFVNGRPLARIGDNISCGSKNATGSPDVFADDRGQE